jgi:hypothetical protein
MPRAGIENPPYGLASLLAHTVVRVPKILTTSFPEILATCR